MLHPCPHGRWVDTNNVTFLQMTGNFQEDQNCDKDQPDCQPIAVVEYGYNTMSDVESLSCAKKLESSSSSIGTNRCALSDVIGSLQRTVNYDVIGSLQRTVNYEGHQIFSNLDYQNRYLLDGLVRNPPRDRKVHMSLV